jgi:hypothetical protein
MLNFVLIANPETRRVQLFQQALERCGVSPARSPSNLNSAAKVSKFTNSKISAETT